VGHKTHENVQEKVEHAGLMATREIGKLYVNAVLKNPLGRIDFEEKTYEIIMKHTYGDKE
jgi:hypothetical protein